MGLLPSPKPLSENGPVHPACVTDQLPSMGPPETTVTAPIPADARRLFGPESPPRSGSEPPVRPRDPDSTGGYYQPVRAVLGQSVVIGLVRIICNARRRRSRWPQTFGSATDPTRTPRRSR
jgi:hypothetical protein